MVAVQHWAGGWGTGGGAPEQDERASRAPKPSGRYRGERLMSEVVHPELSEGAASGRFASLSVTGCFASFSGSSPGLAFRVSGVPSARKGWKNMRAKSR